MEGDQQDVAFPSGGSDAGSPESQETAMMSEGSHEVSIEDFQSTKNLHFDEEMSSRGVDEELSLPPPPPKRRTDRGAKQNSIESPRCSRKRLCLVFLFAIIVIAITIIIWKKDDDETSKGEDREGEEEAVNSGITLSPTSTDSVSPSSFPTPMPTSAASLTPSVAPTITRSLSPSTAAYSYFISLLSEHTAVETLRDPTTAQGQAFGQLLSEGDEMGIPLPNRALQRYALLSFYFSTNSTSWANNDGWDDFSEDECAWFGITDCSTNVLPVAEARFNARNGGEGVRLVQNASFQAITKLEISDNGLEGTLPPEFCLLSPSLQVLDLGNNGLSGSLPACLSNFTKMEVLEVDDNKLSGAMPNRLLALPNLEIVELHGNEFVGTMHGLFEGYGQDSGSSPLKVLRLDGNSLNGTIPSDVLGKFTALQTLAINDNMIGGGIPESVGDLRDMQRLVFSSNNLSGHIPDALFNLKKLMILHLDRNSFSGSISPNINNLVELKELRLQRNKFDDVLPTAELGTLSNLVELELQRNNFDGTIETEDDLCQLLVTAKQGGFLEELAADCDEVVCDCCTTCH